MDTSTDPYPEGSRMARRTTPTVREAVDKYLALRKAKFALDTWINDRSQLRRFESAVGGHRQMHTLTPEDVEEFFFTGVAPLCEQMAASSFNKVRSRVATWLEFCRRRGMIDTDLMAEVGRLKVVKRDRLRLSPSELIALPSYAPTLRDQTMILLAANTALRAGEICRLKVRDLDLAGGWLRVQVQKSQLEDVMPVSTELDAALRLWLTEYTEQAGTLDGEWFLFPGRAPGRNRYRKIDGVLSATYEHGPLKPAVPIGKPALIVQRALKEAGITIEPGEGLHTVRRSVARAFFDHNVARGYDAALRATSALLHHSSTQVTEQYLGLSSEKLHRDDVLRGQRFLTAMVDRANVFRLSS